MAAEQSDPWWGSASDPWRGANHVDDDDYAAQAGQTTPPDGDHGDPTSTVGQSTEAQGATGRGTDASVSHADGDWNGDRRAGATPADVSSDGSTTDNGANSWNARRSSDGSFHEGTDWRQTWWQDGWNGSATDWNYLLAYEYLREPTFYRRPYCGDYQDLLGNINGDARKRNYYTNLGYEYERCWGDCPDGRWL
eukprot:s2167_g4.t1